MISNVCARVRVARGSSSFPLLIISFDLNHVGLRRRSSTLEFPIGSTAILFAIQTRKRISLSFVRPFFFFRQSNDLHYTAGPFHQQPTASAEADPAPLLRSQEIPPPFFLKTPRCGLLCDEVSTLPHRNIPGQQGNAFSGV